MHVKSIPQYHFNRSTFDNERNLETTNENITTQTHTTNIHRWNPPRKHTIYFQLKGQFRISQNFLPMHISNSHLYQQRGRKKYTSWCSISSLEEAVYTHLSLTHYHPRKCRRRDIHIYTSSVASAAVLRDWRNRISGPLEWQPEFGHLATPSCCCLVVGPSREYVRGRVRLCKDLVRMEACVGIVHQRRMEIRWASWQVSMKNEILALRCTLQISKRFK